MIKHPYGDSKLDLVWWLIYTHLLTKLPYSPGVIVRCLFLRKVFKLTLSKATISTGVRLLYPPGIHIGDGVGIARDVTLDGRGGLDIGCDTIIGFEAAIITATHAIGDKNAPIRKQGMFCAPVMIGADVWVGARAIILPGVTIGDNVVIGANAVVSQNVPADTVYGGVPAHFIRRR